MRRALALLAAIGLAGGCGDSGERAAPTTTPTPTASAAPSAARTAAPSPSPSAVGSATPSPPPNGPEAQPGGAGDELPLRLPVRLTVGEDGITPGQVKVNALLGVRLVVRNDTSREQVITVLRARPRRAVSIARGATGTLDLDGLRPGRYVIEGYAAGRAMLVASIAEP
jgi:hypothetical protein